MLAQVAHQFEVLHEYTFDDINPRTPALVLGDCSLSFAELRRTIEQYKCRIHRLPEGVCVVRAHRTPEFVVQFLALLELGVPQAVLPADCPHAEIAARQLCLGPWFELDARGEIIDQSTRINFRSKLHQDTAVILFTSGSTGVPRAVQLSRSSIDANTDAVLEALDMADVDQQILFLPLSYSFGLLGQLLPGLRAGVTTHLVDHLVGLKSMADSGMLRGMVSGVPSHLETLVRLFGRNPAACRHVTHVISAGARLSRDLRERLCRTFTHARIYNNYGQTEMSPRVLSMHSDDPHFSSEAAGYPVRGVEVRLTGEGELCVRGPQMMLGYLGDPEATKQKIIDGWLHTGDHAEIMESGLVTILGRRDDLVKIGGERVALAEIDTALASLPGVTDAAVLCQDHALYGASFAGFLQGDIALGESEIKARLRAALSPKKIPARFYCVDTLPRTGNGKLQRAALAEIATPEHRLR